MALKLHDEEAVLEVILACVRLFEAALMVLHCVFQVSLLVGYLVCHLLDSGFQPDVLVLETVDLDF